MSNPIAPRRSHWRSRLLYLATVLVTAAVTYGVVALFMNIKERKEEAKQHYLKIVELNEDTIDPAECHMPYQREGAVKISNHQVRSPLLNVARACQTCHRYPEEEIKARTEAIQARNKALMDRAEDALVELLDALKAAKQGRAASPSLKEALSLQRKAQWRVDFINAENSMGFHAPQESARILGEAIDYARQAQIKILSSK